MSDTPETDKLIIGYDFRGLPCLEEAVELCRKLERERDKLMFNLYKTRSDLAVVKMDRAGLISALDIVLNAIVLNHRKDYWFMDAEYMLSKAKANQKL